MREPVDVQSDNLDGCPVHTAMMALYMFGLIPEPNVELVSRKLRRKNGELAIGSTMLLMLEHKLRLQRIGTFDGERFGKEGIDYLRKINERELQHLSKEQIAEWQAEVVELLGLYAAYGKQFTTVKPLRQPTMDDICKALNQGKLVEVTMGRSKPNSNGLAALVYGMEGDHPLVYLPRRRRASLTTFHRSLFDKEWWPQERGITIIGQ